MSTADADTIEQTDTSQQVYIPKMYKVVLHNDDTTTFEFVMAVLSVIFHKAEDESLEITMSVHTNGTGIAGVYTREVAEEKTEEATVLARTSGYPLTITCEED